MSNTGYVTCAACGARMKADREWCLRCEAKLVAAPEVPGKLHLPAWLQAWGGSTLIFGTVGTLVLCLLIATVWERRSTDDVARPATNPLPEPIRLKPEATDAKPEATGATTGPSTQPSEPATALDLTRSGGVEFDKGDFTAARARYEQALEKKPDDPDALNSLGLVLERTGKLDEAVARFSRASELVPGKSTYHFNLAHALAQQQQWDRALAEYRTAAGLFPTDYATQYNLAMVLHKKGDDQAAIPEFEKAIRLAPSEPSFHVSLGISLEKVGRLPDALREYQVYLEMAPDAPDAAKLKAHIQELKPAPAAKTAF